MFQNLKPGTYTFTCTLNADADMLETDEGNNTKTITFTVVAKDAHPSNDGGDTGWKFVGWYTGANDMTGLGERQAEGDDREGDRRSGERRGLRLCRNQERRRRVREDRLALD